MVLPAFWFLDLLLRLLNIFKCVCAQIIDLDPTFVAACCHVCSFFVFIMCHANAKLLNNALLITRYSCCEILTHILRKRER